MIRLARPSDTACVAHMWDVCFDDPRHFIKWNFNRNYSPENTLVFEEDGALAANMQLMPYKMRFCGHTLPISYISGVATLPEYRMRGCYRKIQAAAFSLMRARGVPLAVLVPFSFDFYEKQGFSAYCDKTVCEITRPAAPAGGSRRAELSDETIAALDKIYVNACARLNGFVERSARDWRLILEDILYNSGGACRVTDGGYALYLTDKGGKSCEIFELMCVDADAARRLTGSIEGAEKLKITAPASAIETAFPDALRKRERFAMLRIVDVETVLKIAAEDFCGSVGIKIIDENIPENNGVFRISHGTVRRGGEADCEADIKRLARLASGYEADGSFAGGLFKKRENFINLLL